MNLHTYFVIFYLALISNNLHAQIIQSAAEASKNNYAVNVECRLIDSLALVSFYYNLGGGPNWTYDWDLSKPMDTWAGITLNSGGCVKSIIMTIYWKLNGEIPPEIGNLKHLEVFYIRNEPDLIGGIPNEFFSLTNLTDLVIVNTSISGTLSSAVQNLGNLELLQIDNSNMSGEIPEEIGNIQSLKQIVLKDSDFHGSIPASFSQLANLTLLNLWNNGLAGCFEASLGQLCSNNANISVDIGNNFDANWADFCSNMTGCCSGPLCPASIDLNSYSLCGYTHLQETYNQSAKLSGMAYNPYNENIYITNSTTERMFEIDKEGALLKKIELQGFADVESITIVNENTIAVTEEGFRGNIVFVNVPAQLQSNDTLWYPPLNQIIHFPTLMDNSSLEGMTYDRANDVLYFAREKDENGQEMAVYYLASPLSYLGDTITQLQSVFNIDSLLNSQLITDFTDITGLSMTNTGTLLIVSEEGRAIIELNPLTGSFLGHKDVGNFVAQKLQGITIDTDDNLYVLNHNNGKFLTFRKTCHTCPSCQNHVYELPYYENFHHSPKICHQEESTSLHWVRHYNSIGEDLGDTLKVDPYLVSPEPVSINGNNIYAEFYIPCISIEPSLANPYLSFDYRLKKGAGSNVLRVYAEDSNSNRTEIWNEIASQSLPWQNSGQISLSQYSGQIISLEFYSRCQYGSTISFLDNIIISADGLGYLPSSEDCLPNLNLTGTETLFQHDASISIQSSQTIDGEVIYNADQEIFLQTGFEVRLASTFVIQLDGCL